MKIINEKVYLIMKADNKIQNYYVQLSVHLFFLVKNKLNRSKSSFKKHRTDQNNLDLFGL